MYDNKFERKEQDILTSTTAMTSQLATIGYELIDQKTDWKNNRIIITLKKTQWEKGRGWTSSL